MSRRGGQPLGDRVLRLLSRLAGPQEDREVRGMFRLSPLAVERVNLCRALEATDERIAEVERLRNVLPQLRAKQERRRERLRQINAKLGDVP